MTARARGGAALLHPRLVIAAVTALLVAAAPAAAAAPPRGSAAMRVAAVVVAPLRARAPATADVSGPASLTGGVAGGRLVARVAAAAEAPRGTAGVLVGVAGGPARACSRGECEVAIARAEASAGRDAVLVTFVPDGLPPSVVER